MRITVHLFRMKIDMQKQGQEELFIDQAAHLFLALAGIKPLPKENKSTSFRNHHGKDRE